MFRKLAASLALLCLGTVAVQAQGPVTVQVGAQGLVYTPSNFTATNGTIVTFAFSGTHSVTQSTFGAPCTHSGFNSGQMLSGSSFSLVITDDSTPIWFYCTVDTHCGTGMVGAINAPATGNTYAAFKAAAVALGSSEPPQTDASSIVSSGAGAVATTPPTGTTSGASSGPTTTAPSGHTSPTASSPAASATSKSAASRLSSNAGVAIVGGALALLAVAV